LGSVCYELREDGAGEKDGAANRYYINSRISGKSLWRADLDWEKRACPVTLTHGQDFYANAWKFFLETAPRCHMMFELVWMQHAIQGGINRHWCHDRWKSWLKALANLNLDSLNLKKSGSGLIGQAVAKKSQADPTKLAASTFRTCE